MHLFITGEKGVGKSYALTRYLQGIEQSYHGIRTYMSPPKADGLCHIYGGAYKDPPLYDEAHLIGRRDQPGRPQAITATFEGLLLGILEEAAAEAEIIVIDECGFLEREAERFKAKIFDLLEGETPLLGVLKRYPDPFLQGIAAHPRVLLLEISVDNREGIPKLIAENLNRIF